MKEIYSRIPNYTKEEVINIWSDLFRKNGRNEEMTLHCLCSKFDLPYDLNMFDSIRCSGDFENNIRRYLCRVSSLPQYVNYSYNTYEGKQDKELSDLDFIQMNKKSIKEKINKAMEDDNVGMVNKWINSYSNMVKLESELKPIRGLRSKNSPVDEYCGMSSEEINNIL